MNEARTHIICKRFVYDNLGTLERFIQAHVADDAQIREVYEEYEIRIGEQTVGKPDFCLTMNNPQGIVFIEVKSGNNGHAQRKSGEQFKKWYRSLDGQCDGYPYSWRCLGAGIPITAAAVVVPIN